MLQEQELVRSCKRAPATTPQQRDSTHVRVRPGDSGAARLLLPLTGGGWDAREPLFPRAAWASPGGVWCSLRPMSARSSASTPSPPNPPLEGEGFWSVV